VTITASEKKDFYCNACKQFFLKDDATVFKHDEFVRYFCPKCNKQLLFVCIDCNSGIMDYSEQIILGDYDESGVREPFCNFCGHGYRRIDTLRKSTVISKNNLKSITHAILTRCSLPYGIRDQIVDFIIVQCKTKEDVVNFFSDNYDEDKDFVRDNIKGKIVSF